MKKKPPSPKEPKSFAALKREWDAKLYTSGFRDIEDQLGRLKRYEANSFNKPEDFNTIKATERYYQLAGQLLQDYPFSNDKDRRIWAEHAKGYSIAELERKLKINRRYITSVVDRVSRWLRV